MQRLHAQAKNRSIISLFCQFGEDYLLHSVKFFAFEKACQEDDFSLSVNDYITGDA